MSKYSYVEENGKKSFIVTFRKKDERKIKDKGKEEILQQGVGPTLNFIDVGTVPMGFSPPEDPEGVVALDINEYELPMVFTAMSEKEAEKLGQDKENIASVEPDGKTYAQELFFSSDGDLGHGMGGVPGAAASTPQAGCGECTDYQPWGVKAVKAPQCWEATKGNGIYVAVMDTGIWPHYELQGNLIGGISFVPGQSWVDGNGHGTHVAGTIAAKCNCKGLIGVAPSVSVAAFKVLPNSGPGQWSWLMAALYRLGKHYCCLFDVVNISLGATSAPKSLEAYINYASKCALVVCAAGNNGNGVIYPAKYPRALAVSAIDSTNTIASFSSRGPEIELCAPGVNVWSTVPGNSFASFNGTSMAAPHVSGAAALCRGTHRHLDMDQIRKLLIKHADDLGNPGKDEKYGYGRVDALGATYDRTCG